MQALDSGGGRNGVDETLGFFAEVEAAILAEMSDISEFQAPGFAGCRIGKRTTILRDLESGQFLATCGGGSADARHFLESSFDGLFCERSAWLYSWVEARYRDLLAKFACKTGAELIAFTDAPDRAATWIAARLCETEIARHASDRVATSFSIPIPAHSLARTIRHAESSASEPVRFGDVSLALRASVILERLSIEHPKWLGFVTERMRAGILSTQIDAMSQVKNLARSRGASHAAWAKLSAEGPRDLVALDQSNDEARSHASLLDQELVNVVDGARVRHWLARTWCNLHPDMQAAISSVVSAYTGTLEILEPAFRAMDTEMVHRRDQFDGPTGIENEFRGLMTPLLSYVVALRDGEQREAIQARVRAPTRQRWADWLRWGRRLRDRWSPPFWVPMANYSNGYLVAEALSTRADIEQEGRWMANCIARYVHRCFAGRYVLYRIADRAGTSVATYGAVIDLEAYGDGHQKATGVVMDEVSGRHHTPVDRSVEVFAAELTAQIRLQLPRTVIDPSW